MSRNKKSFDMWKSILKSMGRRGHQMCSIKKDVLKHFANFIGKHQCQSLFFNKAAGLTSGTLLKTRPCHRCFPMNFSKLLRTLFYRTPLDDCFNVDPYTNYSVTFKIFWHLTFPENTRFCTHLTRLLFSVDISCVFM